MHEYQSVGFTVSNTCQKRIKVNQKFMLKLWVTNNVFECDLNLNVFSIMSFPRKVCTLIKVHFCMSNNNYYFEKIFSI